MSRICTHHGRQEHRVPQPGAARRASTGPRCAERRGYSVRNLANFPAMRARTRSTIHIQVSKVISVTERGFYNMGLLVRPLLESFCHSHIHMRVYTYIYIYVYLVLQATIN